MRDRILRLVEVVDVGKQTASGANWANWAFGPGGYKDGREVIIKYGAKLGAKKGTGGEGKDKPESKKDDKDEDMT